MKISNFVRYYLFELYSELQKGLDDIAAGRTYTEEEVFAMLDKKFEGYDFE